MMWYFWPIANKKNRKQTSSKMNLRPSDVHKDQWKPHMALQCCKHHFLPCRFIFFVFSPQELIWNRYNRFKFEPDPDEIHRDTWHVLETQNGLPVPLMKRPFWFRHSLHQTFQKASCSTVVVPGASGNTPCVSPAACRFEFKSRTPFCVHWVMLLHPMHCWPWRSDPASENSKKGKSKEGKGYHTRRIAARLYELHFELLLINLWCCSLFTRLLRFCRKIEIPWEHKQNSTIWRHFFASTHAFKSHASLNCQHSSCL